MDKKICLASKASETSVFNVFRISVSLLYKQFNKTVMTLASDCPRWALVVGVFVRYTSNGRKLQLINSIICLLT